MTILSIRILCSILLLVSTFSGTWLVYGRPFPGFAPRNLEDSNSNQNNTRGLYLDFPKGQEIGIWPKGIVYYRFEENNERLKLDKNSRDRFQSAMKAIQDATQNCIKFMEDKKVSRKTQVVIYRSHSEEEPNIDLCQSQCIGLCKNISQELAMTPGHCETEKHSGNYAGIVVHELFHVLGLAHEFQRHDRGQYYTLHRISVETLPDNTFNMTYNYKSIMHYDLAPFINPKPNPPMKPIGTPKNTGQVCRISSGDLNLIEAIYAKECRKDKKKRIFTKGVRIPGTKCGNKVGASEIGMDEGGEMKG